MPLHHTQMNDMTTLWSALHDSCALTLIAAVAYFPDRPKFPPSAAAAAKQGHQNQNESNEDSKIADDTSGLCTYFMCCGAKVGDEEEERIVDQLAQDGTLRTLKSPRLIPAKKYLILKYWIMASAMGIPLGM